MADVWVAAENSVLVRADEIGEIKPFTNGKEARVSVKTALGSYVVSVTSIPDGDPSSPKDVLSVAERKAGELASKIAQHATADRYELAIIDLDEVVPVS